MDAPLRRLLLFPLVFPAVHDGLVSKRRVTAVDAEIVRVQRVPSAGVEKPRVHRFPLEEEVVVGLDVGQVAPEGRADARLTVFLGKRPELTEHEDAVTGRHRRVGLGIEVLTESVQDGVPVHVVRVADVV